MLVGRLIGGASVAAEPWTLIGVNSQTTDDGDADFADLAPPGGNSGDLIVALASNALLSNSSNGYTAIDAGNVGASYKVATGTDDVNLRFGTNISVPPYGVIIMRFRCSGTPTFIRSQSRSQANTTANRFKLAGISTDDSGSFSDCLNIGIVNAGQNSGLNPASDTLPSVVELTDINSPWTLGSWNLAYDNDGGPSQYHRVCAALYWTQESPETFAGSDHTHSGKYVAGISQSLMLRFRIA